jgi:hypothetical protein
MPRRVRETTDAVNSDSFLDIVASVVSIMIIMVVMEGSRIKNAPVTAAIQGDEMTAELEKTLTDEQTMKDDIYKEVESVKQLKIEAGKRRMQRDVLATAVSALEQKVESHRHQLDDQKRQRFDVARNLADERTELDQLVKARQQAETAEGPPVVVESYPTPISRMVDTNEAHFQLSAGAIIHIPMDELLRQFKEDAKRKVYKLADSTELTETLGPIDGFRMKYTLERHDITPEEARSTGRMGSYVQLKRWSLIPVDEGLGEPVNEALSEGSAFRGALAKLRPGRDTITIWIYQDSFAAFREIRKAMYQMGFTIAARPMPNGQLISGSPDGSKSAAQ